MVSLSERVFTSGIVLLVLTGIFMAARIWARLLIIRTVGLDDGMSGPLVDHNGTKTNWHIPIFLALILFSWVFPDPLPGHDALFDRQRH